jgi:phosphoenolpyruvate-protein kinase (PTS system EI component)
MLSPAEAEEKYHALFRGAAELAGGMPVTVMLPDLGNKKDGPGAERGGIRHFLACPDMYRPFLRAVLRAAGAGSFELALPLVSQVAEVITFKEILGEARAGLEKEGLACPLPAVGMVVEVPSVIPALKSFMFECGFFMVGENYPRYLMADPAMSSGGTGVYFSQAFLQQAQLLVEGLKRRKDGARIYGPALRDPVAVPILLGLGFNHMVAPPECLHQIKSIVESINFRDARLITSKAGSYWDPCRARNYAAERIARLTDGFAAGKNNKQL